MMRYVFLCALWALIQNATARGESRNFEVAYPKLLESRSLSSEKVIHIKEGLTLNLEKCSILSENLVLTDLSGKEPVVTPMNGKYMERNLYHDKEKMAAVQVKEENGAVEVSGVISDTLRILPLHLMARAEDGSIAHKIFQVDAPAHRGHDYVETSNIQLEERFNGHHLIRPRQVQVPDPFLIETLVVADKYIYQNFGDDEQFVTYIATSLAAVNIRYRRIRNPRIQLLIVNIAKDLGSDFLRHISVSDPSNATNTLKIYTSYEETLPRFAMKYRHATCDAAMLVTGLELADQDGADISTNVKGFAHLDGLCRGLSRACIVEDVAHTYYMVTVAAHEMGHLLGMPHDGNIPDYDFPNVTWERCSATSGYLMAPSLLTENEGFFSHCSLQHMRVLLRHHSEGCFEVKSKKAFQAPGQLPGVGLDMTDLCKKLHPDVPGIKALSKTMLSNKCQFQCYGKVKNSPVSFTERFVDGMSCGTGRICFRSKCGYYRTDMPPLPTLPIPETTTTTPNNSSYDYDDEGSD
ncbi:venom metalloproteinase antarease-like TtrivMP_A [Ixodes scapularis]|uniref:venom metalloproteinase antarease-like TtrivMP_A n=1 Tax=Ixodes scapularis TaxID=6945 RepID=UPI001A9F82E1|nr:venom metalloproteinase antarease-like TtrivMP_A [Ixodes scapularis]